MNNYVATEVVYTTISFRMMFEREYNDFTVLSPLVSSLVHGCETHFYKDTLRKLFSFSFGSTMRILSQSCQSFSSKIRRSWEKTHKLILISKPSEKFQKFTQKKLATEKLWKKLMFLLYTVIKSFRPLIFLWCNIFSQILCFLIPIKKCFQTLKSNTPIRLQKLATS